MLNCPRCRVGALEEQPLESALLALTCPQCAGHWIKGFQYWKWLEQYGPNLPEKPAGGDVAPPAVAGGDHALLCPDCKHILGRYEVGHDLSFVLDHCAHCGGIWFDGGEWEALKARNLHDDVQAIFSDVWQAKIRHEAQAERHEQNLRALLGEEDLAELRRVKGWLMAHPQRYAIHALLHPDTTL